MCYVSVSINYELYFKMKYPYLKQNGVLRLPCHQSWNTGTDYRNRNLIILMGPYFVKQEIRVFYVYLSKYLFTCTPSS